MYRFSSSVCSSLDKLYISRNLCISSKLSSLLVYSCLWYSLTVLFYSFRIPLFLFISDFGNLNLLSFFFFSVHLAKGLLIYFHYFLLLFFCSLSLLHSILFLLLAWVQFVLKIYSFLGCKVRLWILNLPCFECNHFGL